MRGDSEPVAGQCSDGERRPPKVALTIAGLDPSSGAGLTADLQVFAAHGLFGTAAITAMTVQSTQRVAAVEPVRPELLTATLAELQADMPAAGVKIGMLGSTGVVRAVAAFLRELPTRPPVVLDPVLRSSTGSVLLEPAALAALQGELLPLVDVMTPNWAELAALSGAPVRDAAGAQTALEALGNRLPSLALVATGGDQPEPNDCVRLPDGRLYTLAGTHVETRSTHGTGCAFSSSLLSGLVQGENVLDAAARAKRYVEGALRSAPGLGGGRGPMDLLWPLRRPVP